jgi:phosphoglycolate phosphatase-like HAD superfamily hydrolase
MLHSTIVPATAGLLLRFAPVVRLLQEQIDGLGESIEAHHKTVMGLGDLPKLPRNIDQNASDLVQPVIGHVLVLTEQRLHLFQMRGFLFEPLDAEPVVHGPIIAKRPLGLSSCLTHSALVLFDIDGTLVRRAGPHHREALVVGVRRVTGLETTTEGIPVQGMLDPDIIRAMMRRAGARAGFIREAMPEIQAAAERYYLRVCPPLHDKHCPGVERVLQRLQARGVLLALVTGNLTRIGWRKLGRAGLRRYFRFGAFGEMAKTRAGLARLAMREARSRGWVERGAPVSLVGDAPQDIEAARANRIQSICVQTGITPVAELEALRPDVFLRDLRELRMAMVTERT